MDSFEICRVCMEEVAHFTSLFKIVETIPLCPTPAFLITECCGIEINPADGLPELVCDDCLTALVQAYNIRMKCISSERKLRKILLHSYTVSAGQRCQKEQTLKCVSSTNMKLVVKSKPLYDNDKILDENLIVHQTKTKPDSVPCVVRTTTINRVEDKTEGQQYSSVEQQDLGEEFLIEDSKESTEDTENEKLLVHLGIASDHEISPNSTMPVATETIKMEVEIVNPVISDTATTSSESQVVSHSCTEAVANTNAHQNVCLVCEKVLSSKGNLKSHMSVHSDEKPFCCEVCGRRFAKKHNYNIHMLRHSGKRTHQCSLCDKSFVCSINLKNHMRIHSPTKPFACAFCGKKFTYLADKKHHEYSHTGDYPFCCKNCPRKFTKKHLFNRHLPVCMKKFEGMERPTTTRKQSRISDECSSKIKD